MNQQLIGRLCAWGAGAVYGVAEGLCAGALCVLLLVRRQKENRAGQGGLLLPARGAKGARNAARELQRCDAPVATVALAENPNGYTMGGSYHLPASLKP